MYVLEKSDCAVVPVNQPNKGRQLSAEVGEGRAQTGGEHHSTAHAPDSEQEFCMSQRLDDVREANRSLGSLYAIHSSEEPYA
jgi:hypothetical protein